MPRIASLLHLLPFVSAAFVDLTQQPLGGSKKDLIYELKIAEVIPTVLDEFVPQFGLSIFWENATAEVGNTVSPSRVQKAPALQLLDALSQDDVSMSSKKKKKKYPQLTVALTDPDAPSRDNPEWSQICHWIVTNIHVQGPSSSSSSSTTAAAATDEQWETTSYDEIMPWKPPGPPEKTGKHRYVFVALAPANGTMDKLHLTKPGDRQHWGFKHERQGLRKWAKRNGLAVVGANFIYAQNEKQ